MPKMGMDPQLTRGALAAMVAEAARAHPNEACGLLLGRVEDGAERITAIRPAANVAADPTRHFEIDPATLIAALRAERERGPERGPELGPEPGKATDGQGDVLLGWYHSHPAGEATPSATDRASAPRDGRLWAIIARGTVRLWRDGAQGFEMLPTRLADG